MIIGVTGSRTWNNWEMITEAFDKAFHDFGDPAYPNVVIVGSAGGADGMCKAEAIRRGWHPAQMMPLWGHYGKAAGYMRDTAMVYVGMHADCWLAFIDECAKEDCIRKTPHDSHGTAITVKAARKAGIEVREHRGSQGKEVKS